MGWGAVRVMWSSVGVRGGRLLAWVGGPPPPGTFRPKVLRGTGMGLDLWQSGLPFPGLVISD